MFPLIKKGLTLRNLLHYLGISIVILLFVGYALFQARFILTGPTITFLNSPEITQTQRSITLEGMVQNIVFVSLNGRQIYTDKNGYFKEILVLENGYTIATLQVKDRYGRERSYTKEFVYLGANDQ